MFYIICLDIDVSLLLQCDWNVLLKLVSYIIGTYMQATMHTVENNNDLFWFGHVRFMPIIFILMLVCSFTVIGTYHQSW